MTHDSATIQSSLARSILQGIDNLIADAEQKTRPLEVDPYRERLFEFFVTAHGAGYLEEDAGENLTADALCHLLAGRWGLGEAARQSVSSQTKLSPDELAKMRSLWSVMRMWMEWTYAWDRWHEFHADSRSDS